MDGYYHRNQNLSGGWDHRFSPSAYDYHPPRGVYLDRRGSAPSGDKYHSMLAGPNNFYGSGTGGGSGGGGGPFSEGGGAADNSRTNLIVNYLPQGLAEKELYNMFVTFGPIESCKIMKDFNTGYSYGFGFVNFVREEDAAAAISSLNGIPLQNKRIKVSYARPSGDDIKETNLYVTNLPRDITEHQLEVIFGKYGRIVQKRILRDKNSGMARGTAFVRFDKREEAQEAISALNNVIPEGGSEPLGVKIAEEHGKQKAAYYSNWSSGFQHHNRGDALVPPMPPPAWGGFEMDEMEGWGGGYGPPVAPHMGPPYAKPGRGGRVARAPLGRGNPRGSFGGHRGASRGRKPFYTSW